MDSKNQRLDRHSGAGVSGNAKKEGHGKGGWGKDGQENAPVQAIDKNDPNYDSSEENEEEEEESE
eukprot:TRINITY_DN1006_c0_g1_i1.p1 TRINITY_DN1006_c0_g1~~TRINITY_DN1006_c0_g1_i1.p1  ORF type:complete len:75 (-),score=33.80 TRINITY_DN1006_c0_g1_i1:136-330(-)